MVPNDTRETFYKALFSTPEPGSGVHCQIPEPISWARQYLEVNTHVWQHPEVMSVFTSQRPPIIFIVLLI